MEFHEYIGVARRRWQVIVAGLLLGPLVAAVVTLQMSKVYESNARLFVSTTAGAGGAASYQDSVFSGQRAASYADLATGRELASRVIERLDLPLEPAELAAKVRAEVVPQTVIIELSVQDHDPRLAEMLTQVAAEELTAYVDDLETPPGEARAPFKVSVIDAAGDAGAPVAPAPLKNLALGLLFGVVFGVALAVFRELMDTSLKTADEVADAAAAPVVGLIPYDTLASRTDRVDISDGHSPTAEAFRVLRTNLQFVDVDSPKKAVVVSSALPQEGKTTTAISLAMMMAQAGQRVVLIDADLRRPTVADRLGLEGAVGLSTVLAGKATLVEAVQNVDESGLRVLTSGLIPPNPAELLQSNAMARLLSDLRETHDLIILDAPPMLPVADAAVLSTLSDGCLLITRAGLTTRHQVEQSVDRLKAVDARLMGCVLNMVRHRRFGGLGYGYGYGYGYAPVPRRRRRRTLAPWRSTRSRARRVGAGSTPESVASTSRS